MDRTVPPAPAAKKAKHSSTPHEPDEPLDFVARVREKSEDHFAPPGKGEYVNNDVEQNIREIRALLKINSEIFARCISSATAYNGKTATFTRYGFYEVKVRQNQANAQFITEHVRDQQMFDMKTLSQLPDGLSNVFVTRNQAEPSNMYIDYDAFFRTAIMLHDDILGHFLVKLKSHLELIHVCLGGIETWLLEPERNIEFLESAFGITLERPTDDDFDKECSCPPGTHINTDVCLKCHHNYGRHTFRRYSIRHRRDQVPTSVYKYLCPSVRQQSSFRCKKFHVLKTCEAEKSEESFAMAEQSDRDKLTTLLSSLA